MLSVPIAAYRAGIAQSETDRIIINILQGLDITGLVAAETHTGHGLDVNEMLNAEHYREVYEPGKRRKTSGNGRRIREQPRWMALHVVRVRNRDISMSFDNRIRQILRSWMWWLCACTVAAWSCGALAAGSGARVDGPGGGFAWFTTGGQVDALFAKIDTALWYSTGAAFTNISAGIGGNSVETFQAPTRDFIWAGSDAAGVWVSFDRGATWQARNTGLTCLSITHAVVTNTGSMYVSTRCSGVDAVFRSFDRGLTWLATAPLPNGGRVNRMNRAADQTQSYAYLYTTMGSFRMGDTSSTWSADQDRSGSPFRNVPAGSDVIEGFQSAASLCVMLVRNVGPYRTENCPIGGASQPAATLQTQGLPPLSNFGNRIGLVNNEQLIPVVGEGLYRFDRTSGSWVRAYSENQVPGIRYIRDISAGSSTLFASSLTSGIWRSTDSGVTWQPFGLANSAPTTPVQTLTPVTPPPQTSFAFPTGQMPSAAVASVEVSSDTRSLTVSVQLDLSKMGIATGQSFAAANAYSVYVVAAVPGERLGAASGTKLLFQHPADGSWGNLTSPIAAFAENVAVGAADQRVRVEILSSMDMTNLRGTEFYVGYGTSDTEMLQAQRYRGVYLVD